MHKKIDIFYNGKYLCSTNWSKTCKEAKEKYYNSLLPGIKETVDKNKLKAFFDKERK